MLLKVAICEDDVVQRKNLQRIVGDWGKSREYKIQLFAYRNCEAFLFDWDQKMDFDLLLLDIDLDGGMGGMDLARHIRQRDGRIAILFVTGLAEYMNQGYDVQAFHFLVKPVEEGKMQAVLDKAMQAVEKKEEYLLLEGENEMERIPVSRILYVEAFSHTVALYLTPPGGEGSVICKEMKMGLKDVEERLTKTRFVRCHRSYLVHLAYIQKIDKSQVYLDYVNPIPVSRERRKALYQAFLDYHKDNVMEDISVRD